MQSVKKFLALALSLFCVFALAAPAMAADMEATASSFEAVDPASVGMTQEEINAYATEKFGKQDNVMAAADNWQNVGCYTDFFNSKPAVFVYLDSLPHTGNDASRVKVLFDGWRPPVGADGVDTNSPQVTPSNHSGWQIYYISKRFITLHTGASWNDDGRWQAKYNYN